MSLTDLEWYLQKFENAIDANRDEEFVISHLAEDIENGGKEGETPEMILETLLREKKIIKIVWGENDSRYYLSEEIKSIFL